MEDEEFVDAITGYLGMMTTCMGDGSTHAYDKQQVDSAGADRLRARCNKSDGINYNFAP